LCYGRGRDALLKALPEVPAMSVLIEAVEGYFAAWEDRWRVETFLVEQAPTTEFVRAALAKLGLRPPEQALAEFTDAILETSVYTAKVEPAEAGMAEALAALCGRGLRLGCVSNAFMGAAVLNRILDERGLGPYCEHTVSSCEIGYRKPHPSIYEEALRALGVSAAETMFVGDRVDADVEGPASLGMMTVLTHQYRQEDPMKGSVRPDHVIRHLGELVGYVDKLRR
jgi:HAD superfamily hydrolase (TIGR01549 family)